MAIHGFYCPHCKCNTVRDVPMDFGATRFGEQKSRPVVVYPIRWGCVHAEKVYYKLQRKRTSKQIRSASIMGMPPLVP